MQTSGQTFEQFLSAQNFDSASESRFRLNTFKILERTGLITKQAGSTQLVVGQVQSGKTMSFTGLIAAARDNDFAITVLIAGTKKNLFAQSVKRLRSDLRIDGDGGANPWMLLEKPNRQHSEQIIEILNNWHDPKVPTQFKKSGLLVALKSRAGIDKLTDLLVEVAHRSNLSQTKVLIIDDEADQASLNFKPKKGRDDRVTTSAIYGAITRLRDTLPNHSFIMYTATPQAPLLLKLEDHLSPQYVTLLSPGDDYLGGRELFADNAKFHMCIPEDELDLALNPQHTDGAPATLRFSVAYFLLALTIAQERRNPRPISMMIHPSSSMALHDVYGKWVNAILDEWRVSLSDTTETAFSETVSKDFVEPFNLIRNSVKIPNSLRFTGDIEVEVSNLLSNFTRHWLSHIQLRIINGANPDINPTEWNSHAGWIVIGGNKLERGFTVENLAVTYMPRSPGVGNADVIQQRARFFGYKRKYADLLKAWLSQDTIDSYMKYVEHENEMHSQLREIDATDSSLKNWRRKFLLDKSMKICRSQVIGLPIVHEQLKPGFVFEQTHLFTSNLHANDQLNDKFSNLCFDSHKFLADKRPDKFTEVSSLKFEDLLEILTDWNASPVDREQIDRVIFALQLMHDQTPQSTCAVYRVDMTISGQATRSRGIASVAQDSLYQDRKYWRIKQLFQGRNPKEKDKLTIYPGDRELRSKDLVSVQIHRISPKVGEEVFPSIYALAIALPNNISKGIVWEIS